MGPTGVQYIVTALIAGLVYMSAISLVWPSYALRVLESTDSPLGYAITKYDANLIGSVFMLGSLAAVLVMGYINDKIGRRRTEILSALFFVLSWIILTAATSVTQIIIARFLLGFAGGIQMISNVIFISEIAQVSLQGSLLSAQAFAFNIGGLTSYMSGWFCSYKLVNYINLSMGVVLVILLCFLKETPPYLIRNGKEKEALNSLKFYRGAKTTTQEILDEFHYLCSQQQANNHSSGANKTKLGYEKVTTYENYTEVNNATDNNLKQSSWKILLASKSSQRALIITTTHLVLAVFIGMIGIQTYAGTLFSRVAPDISPDLCSVILAVVLTISSAIAVFLTDLIPRRALMFSGISVSVMSLLSLASMLRWSWAPDWCIPVMILSFCLFFQLGPANVTVVQIGECISPQLNSLCIPIVMCNMLLANFILLYVFQPAVDILGLDGIFFLFSIIGVVTTVVAYLFMRETKKEPCENVQNMFEQGWIYRRI